MLPRVFKLSARRFLPTTTECSISLPLHGEIVLGTVDFDVDYDEDRLREVWVDAKEEVFFS